MINSISQTNGVYTGIAKKNNVPEQQKSTNTSAPVAYADSSTAIKSQLGVSVPIPYSFIRDIKIPYSEPAKYYKLANGQKVIILQKKGPTVVKSYFNVGSMNEREGEKGIFHFIEHMKFNGSEHLKEGEFFDTVNKMGGSTNASTGMSTTDYYVMLQLLNKDDLETTIKIHSDMIQTPKHTPEMVEKEKGPVTSEISMVSDEPVNLGLNNCIKNLFGIKTNVVDLIAGNINTVSNLTSEKVKEYDAAWYSPDNCITVITGNVDPQKTIELVSKYFNSTRKSNTENRTYTTFTPLNAPVRNDLIMPKANNTTILLGFVGPKNNSEKELLIQNLLADIMFNGKHGRLSAELDKIHSSGMFTQERIGNRPDDRRAMLFVSQTTPEKSENVLKTYYQAVQKLKNTPITQKELEKEKLAYKMALSTISENSAALNSLIGSCMMDNLDNFLENNIELLDSITTKDLDDFIKKYFDLNKAAITLVHPDSVNSETLFDNYKKNAAVSFKGSENSQVFDENRIKQYRLQNNFAAVFNPNTSEIANYRILLDTRVPAMVKPGTSELLSKILQEGSIFRDNKSFYGNAEEQGIYLNINSNAREINVSCISPESKLTDSLKYAKEALLYPRFTKESLDYARASILETLNNIDVSAEDKLNKELFPNISEFATNEEIKNSINNVTLEDVTGLYQYIMQNAEASFALTAPVEKNPDLVNQSIQELSTNFPTFKPLSNEIFNIYTPVQENKLLTTPDKRIQAEIEQAYTFKVNSNPKDRLIFMLMNNILGGNPSSRLFMDLREKQKLAYKVNSSFDRYGNTGIITCFIKTTTDDPDNKLFTYDNVKKSLDGFKKHIEKLKTEKVSLEELEAAKLRLKTDILNDTESSADRTAVLLSNIYSPYSIKGTDTYLKLIDEITPDDIYNAANYAFGGNSVTSIVASPDTLENMSL